MWRDACSCGSGKRQSAPIRGPLRACPWHRCRQGADPLIVSADSPACEEVTFAADRLVPSSVGYPRLALERDPAGRTAVARPHPKRLAVHGGWLGTSQSVDQQADRSASGAPSSRRGRAPTAAFHVGPVRFSRQGALAHGKYPTLGPSRRPFAPIGPTRHQPLTPSDRRHEGKFCVSLHGMSVLTPLITWGPCVKGETVFPGA